MSLFWAITLMSDHKGHHLSRRYLSVFMLVPALVLFCHFLYFAPFPEWYVCFDLPLQFFGMMVFPLYHIYFRLLTVDDKISFKKHIRFLLLPLGIFIVYTIAVFNAPLPEYKAWLFNKIINPGSQSIKFLHVARIMLQIGFLIQCIYCIVANHILINKYADRAVKFYSDMRDAKARYARMLNLSVIVSGMVTLALVVVGRTFLMTADEMIFMGWSVLTVAVYLIGSLGAKQKVINPDLELPMEDEPAQLVKQTVIEQEIFINKIVSEFRENKIYLKSDLTIHDLAKTVGTNRTYLSTAINQKFNLNFCTFVNGYRVKELERIILENPDYLLDQYVQLCGFGSVNSMKRSVSASKGMSFSNFRSTLLMKKGA